MKDDQPHRRRQSWEHLLEKDPSSATGFRVGFAAALLVHAGIFAITWPTIAQAPPAEPEDDYIPHRLVDVRYPPRPPEPPPPDLDFSNQIDDASIIVPGPPEEIPAEPVERELPPPPDVPTVVVLPTEIPDPPPPPVKTVWANRDVEPPKLKSKVEPRYPEPARQAHVEGVVVLELVIDTQGAVESIKVHKGLPLGLTKSAVDAVTQWRFAPSTYNGHPVAVRYILTVRFSLA